MRFDVRVVAHSISTGIDSESINASCTLEANAVVYEEKSLRILTTSTAKETEPFEKNDSQIKVYYPAAGDTLFSVAKRFHTSSVKVATDNSIAESVFASDNPDGKLAGIKRLIIL